MSKIVKNEIDYIGSTYQSLPAQSGGTATSLVTTGEKYVWNNLINSGVHVFLDEPTVPYTEGDLWVTDGMLYYCTSSRISGSFNEDDWNNAIDVITEDDVDDKISTATAIISGNSGGKVIWYDSDQDGQPDEILVTNTPDLSGKVFKYNATTGLTFSATGYNGTYQTIIDANGHGVADYLTGNLDASQVQILNFTSDMVHGGKLVRGGLNNVKGTIEIQDAQNLPIGEITKDGIKLFGAGNIGQRPYVVFSPTEFFAGYDANGQQLFKVVGEDFQVQKLSVATEMTINNKVGFIPITITSGGVIVNDGIAVVGL